MQERNHTSIPSRNSGHQAHRILNLDEKPKTYSKGEVPITQEFKLCLGCGMIMHAHLLDAWVVDQNGNLIKKIRAVHPECTSLVEAHHKHYHFRFIHPFEAEDIIEEQNKTTKQVA